MINENMKKVLVALRSGEYKQTQESLQDKSGHCCLGVMCEVYEKETGDTIPRSSSGLIIGGDLGVRRQKVRRWVGLKHHNGSCLVGKSLISMNDANKSFIEIADHIESQPEGLLV